MAICPRCPSTNCFATKIPIPVPAVGRLVKERIAKWTGSANMGRQLGTDLPIETGLFRVIQLASGASMPRKPDSGFNFGIEPPSKLASMILVHMAVIGLLTIWLAREQNRNASP